MPEGLSAHEVGKEIAEHAERKRRGRRPGTSGPPRLDRRGRPPVDRRSDGGLVGLRGGEVEHRVPRGPGRGLDREDARRTGRTSKRSSFGTSTPRPSRRGSPPTPPTTSRRWPLRSIASGPSSGLRSRPGGRRSPRRIPTRLGARPTCRSTDSRSSGRRRRSTSRRMRPSPQARARARRPTSTYAPPSSSRASSFLVGISTRFLARRCGTRSLRLALCCWSSPSCSSRSCPVRPPDLTQRDIPGTELPRTRGRANATRAPISPLLRDAIESRRDLICANPGTVRSSGPRSGGFE